MVVGSLSAQSNKNKYPQTKVYRGDSVVILSIDQSDYINKTFKEQKIALDSFKVVTDTLIRYKDSIVTKFVKTDSILTITDSLRKELLAYKKKVEEAAKLGLYVTYDTIREQAKFLPFEKDFKVNIKQTETGVKLFATSYSQYTNSRVALSFGLAGLSGFAQGVQSEISNHPYQFKNTFPTMPTTFWDHFGYTGPSSWGREMRIGNIWFRSDLWQMARVVNVSSLCIAFPIGLYETTTWKQILKRSLIISSGHVIGYNLATKVVIR
jgi:hypothetical protein